MTARSDFLIIGGGIAGVGAAALLAEHGRVTVLEGEDAIGHHATGRSAAIFIRNYGNATLRALNALAAPVFDDPGPIADAPLLSPRGEMLLAEEDELGAFEAYLEGSEGMQRISPDEAAARVPILQPGRIAAAALEEDARDIDVDRLFQGYARLLRARGGRIETRAPVRALTHADGLWKAQTPGDSFESPVLINAAGAWADGLARLAGVRPLGLQAYRRSAALLPLPDIAGAEAWPLFGSVTERWYAKPEAGMLMVSPAEEDPVDPHDAWVEDMALAEGLYRFEQAVTLSVTRVARSWAGLRTFAPDRTPVIGFVPEAPGFFWLAGQGGYGIQTAPALSALASDLCRGAAPAASPDLLAALAPGRFI
jgi:D-arginine dehydrogenase